MRTGSAGKIPRGSGEQDNADNSWLNLSVRRQTAIRGQVDKHKS